MSPIRLLLVDDDALVRAGLRAILDAEPDLVVVGEADDGVEVAAWPGVWRSTSSCSTCACPG